MFGGKFKSLVIHFQYEKKNKIDLIKKYRFAYKFQFFVLFLYQN